MGLQTKLSGGVMKIQQSIEQGKQKLQIAQEINKCRNIIEETAGKRAEELIKLGEAVYRKIRLGEIQDPHLLSLSEVLVELDKVLYQTKEKMEKLLENQEKGNVCMHCKHPLSPGGRFCGACGQPVAQEEENSGQYTACPRCEQNVPYPADFCTCCGIKLS
jgi:NADH pyrophosphatase NudC (nudix superfamily)